MSRPAALSPTAVLIALISLAALAALTLGAPRAEAAKARCGATFQVLHNDRIGDLKLPAGHYDITLLNPQRLSCARASKLFARFLQDYNGVLPRGWRLNVAKARFKKGRGRGFEVSRSGGGTGLGGQHPQGTALKCATFRVLHNDRIAGVNFPQGTYQMTALGGLTCSKGSTLFARFLQGAQTALPGRWKLDGRTGTFTRGTSGKGFQVNHWR